MSRSKRKNRALFITFEGGEGAGKSTLIEGVEKVLHARGTPLFKTREPGGCAVGEKIREIVLHARETPLTPRCELFLFLADRSQHVEEEILPRLEAGVTVLCDRYNDSTIAYQVGARGLDLHAVETISAFATQGLLPDLTFYLDIDPRIGLERVRTVRGSQDKIEAESIAFHQNIRKAFLALAERESSRFCILDAEQTREQLLQQALFKIDQLLGQQLV